ncbi:hypothetical protein VSX61_22065 [Brenneria populi subsp. brevivirga]|uniref:hypothetical protein n=1 Tax=Brenneria populi TaxID=1505588 RepID=UPI002E1925E5|nr:hypothetical protein [Brenneria populi subsp. brevivirga]
MTEKIDFYQEITIIKSTVRPEFIGRTGVVMGISEEDNILYGYTVRIQDYDYLVFFDPDDLEPTGKRFKREDFY